jgi:hypothetical protein
LIDFNGNRTRSLISTLSPSIEYSLPELLSIDMVGDLAFHEADRRYALALANVGYSGGFIVRQREDRDYILRDVTGHSRLRLVRLPGSVSHPDNMCATYALDRNDFVEFGTVSVRRPDLDFVYHVVRYKRIGNAMYYVPNTLKDDTCDVNRLVRSRSDGRPAGVTVAPLLRGMTVSDFTISPDGDTVVAVGRHEEQAVCVFSSVSQYQVINVYKLAGDMVAFSPDGLTVAIVKVVVPANDAPRKVQITVIDVE